LASKSVEAGVSDAEARWEECSFCSHRWFVRELLVSVEEQISLGKVVVNITSAQHEHTKSFWKMNDRTEEEKLGRWLDILLNHPLLVEYIEPENLKGAPFRPKNVYRRWRGLIYLLHLY
jgi:hypothetical protein